MAKKILPQKEWEQTLPTKRVSAQIIVRNKMGDFLLVKPTYRDYWIMLGGVVEEGESPIEGAKREAQEELGLTFSNLLFTGIDYGYDPSGERSDWMHVIFTATLPEGVTLDSLEKEKEEIEEVRFFSLGELRDLTHPSIFKRLQTIEESTGPYYLHNGGKNE